MAKGIERTLEVLVVWTIFTASFPTILLYRAAVQPTYQWGLFGITGEGLSPGYGVILLTTGWAWATIYYGMREGRAPFPFLTLVWNTFLLISLIIGIVRSGSDLNLRGDAMGLQINLALIGPLLVGTMLLLSLLWWWRRPRPSSRALMQWTPSAKPTMLGALGLTPIIILLFLIGDGLDHTTMDRLAIGLVILQCILLSVALGMQNPIVPARQRS